MEFVLKLKLEFTKSLLYDIFTQLNLGSKRSGVTSFNPHSTYYILNPHGDLKNTEKRFANFFTNEKGWSGVIGSPPSHEEFTAALRDKDLYVYVCKHHFLLAQCILDGMCVCEEKGSTYNLHSLLQVLWSQCWSFSGFKWFPATQLSSHCTAGWL